MPSILGVFVRNGMTGYLDICMHCFAFLIPCDFQIKSKSPLRFFLKYFLFERNTVSSLPVFNSVEILQLDCVVSKPRPLLSPLQMSQFSINTPTRSLESCTLLVTSSMRKTESIRLLLVQNFWYAL